MMYEKYFASHFSDVRTATIALTDSGLSFGEFFDPFEANYPGVIYFSLADGLCDCNFFVGTAPLGSSAIPAFCEYDFLVSASAADSTVPMMDSIWIQKTPSFVFGDTLNLTDSNAFLPVINKEFYLSDLVYASATPKFTDTVLSITFKQIIDSIYFVYRKDTSYFAYCQLLQSNGCFSFQIQCVFQNDGSTYFPTFELESHPYPSWFHSSDMIYFGTGIGLPVNEGTCLTWEEVEKYVKVAKENAAITSQKQNRQKESDSKSYQLNGSPSSGNHTGVVIENGKAKLRLKK